jgi:hypothetical protein
MLVVRAARGESIVARSLDCVKTELSPSRATRGDAREGGGGDGKIVLESVGLAAVRLVGGEETVDCEGGRDVE